MAQESTLPPPPTDSPDMVGAGSGGGMDRFRGIISKLSGGGTPMIDQRLAEHHAQRKAEADLAKQQWEQVTREYARETDPAKKEALKQKYEIAKQRYAKIAGQSKEAKPIIQQTINVIEHLIGHKGGGQDQAQEPGQGGQGASGGRTSTVPAPPTQAAAAGSASSTIPLPPMTGGGGAAKPAAMHEGNISPTGGVMHEGNILVRGSSAGPGGAGAKPGPSSQSSDSDFDIEAGGAPVREEMAKHSRDQADLDADSKRKIAEEQGKNDPKVVFDQLVKMGVPPDEARKVVTTKIGGVGMRQRMHSVQVSNPDGTRIPALQDVTTGEVFGPDGQVIDNPTIIPTGIMPTSRTGEMPVFNPSTNQFEQQPTYSSSRKTPIGGGGKSTAPKTSVPAPPGKGGGSSKSAAPAAPGSGGRHGIPARQYNILQKQATAVDEARNSLIGSDPKSIGGLAADLGIFRNPASIKRISEYLGLVNSQMSNEAKAVAGQGAWAAAEWYAGLPKAVISLQQGALADASRGLLPDEQRFVADYYRVLGTIGGMRAATGASAAQWSFNALRAELPTPGPVTNYGEAKRRLNNYVEETNVVAKRNPLLQPADTSRLSTAPPPPKGTRKFTDSGRTYNIPANMVKEFKQDHPNATE